MAWITCQAPNVFSQTTSVTLVISRHRAILGTYGVLVGSWRHPVGIEVLAQEASAPAILLRV